MPTYTAPQVDHNLYNTQLPQSRMMEVFSLLENKQGLYNQGLAQARNTLASMDHLPDEVTGKYTKQLVTDFNGKAREQIKSYQNVDFSLQSNVDLIANTYNPLIQDQTFMADYTATLNLKSQVQKAMSFRDSNKKDMYERYSDVNLQNLYNKFDGLANATTEAGTLEEAGNTANARYTPYTDYKKTIRELVTSKAFFVTEEQSPDGRGYMINHKGVKYGNMKRFLEANLTANELGQIKIEGEVAFFSAYKNSLEPSKADFVFNATQDTVDRLQQAATEIDSHVSSLKNKFSSYGADKSLNNRQRADKAKLKAAVLTYETQVETLRDKIENSNSTLDKFSKGELSADQIYSSLENNFSTAYINGTIDQMADGFNFQSKLQSKDEVFWARVTENRLSRQLSHSISNDNRQYGLDVAKFRADELAKAGGVMIDGKLVSTLEGKKLEILARKSGLVQNKKTGEWELPPGDGRSMLLKPGDGESNNKATALELNNRVNENRTNRRDNANNSLKKLVSLSDPSINKGDIQAAFDLLKSNKVVNAANFDPSNIRNNPNGNPRPTPPLGNSFPGSNFSSETFAKQPTNRFEELIKSVEGTDSAAARGLRALANLAGNTKNITPENILELVAKGVGDKLENNGYSQGTELAQDIYTTYSLQDQKLMLAEMSAASVNERVINGFTKTYPEFKKGASIGSDGQIVFSNTYVAHNPTNSKETITLNDANVKEFRRTHPSWMIGTYTASKTSEILETYLASTEGNAFVQQGKLVGEIGDPAQASAWLFSNPDNYKAFNTNFSLNPSFSNDFIEKDENDDFDGIKNADSGTAKFLNTLTATALSNGKQIFYSNENVVNPATRVTDIDEYGNVKIFFNVDYLERINGMKDDKGDDRDNYKTDKNGLSAQEQRDAIQILATKGVTIKAPPKVVSTTGGLVLENLAAGDFTAPVQTQSKDYKAYISYNKETKEMDVQYDIPDGKYLYNTNTMFTFDGTSFKPTIQVRNLTVTSENMGPTTQDRTLHTLNKELITSEDLQNKLEDNRLPAAVQIWKANKDIDFNVYRFNLAQLKEITDIIESIPLN